MTVPFSAVLDALDGYAFTTTIPDCAALRFSWASFLPQGGGFRPDRLYLCEAKDAAALQPKHPDCYFMCITLEKQEISLPPHCVFFYDIHSLITLATLVQERFALLRDWLASLNDTATSDPDYQTLLDQSEGVVPNPVYILDASFKLLACTKHLVDDDEIDLNLRSIGYHSEEALTAIRNCQRIHAYHNEVGTLINPPGNPNKYATVSKWIWDHGMPVVHVIMVCSNVRQPTASVLSLFECLAENCALCFQQQQCADPHTGHYYDSFINDLLFNGLDNPRIIAERAKLAGLSMHGRFQCLKIILQDVNSFPTARLMDLIAGCLPDSPIITHNYEIIVLHSAADSGKAAPELIRPLLEKHNALCGVSEPFDALPDYPIAYTQATRAIGLGEPLLRFEPEWDRMAGAPGCIAPPRDAHIFYYDDIFVYYAAMAAHTASFDVFAKTPYLEIVRSMLDADREHGTNNAQMLYTYLACERKATRTGELLHMHRNNVLYRIPRIAESVGLDLDDYWVRFKLLLAFHLTELQLAHQHFRALPEEE